MADVDVFVHIGNGTAATVHSRSLLPRFHTAAAAVLRPPGRAHPSLPLACGDGKALVLQANGESMMLTNEPMAQHK